MPLNARGRAQAAHCGEVLRDLFAKQSIDPAALDFVSSPLGRARETMELARAALGLDPDGYRIEPRLIEISFGDWEGFTIAELRCARAATHRGARARQMALRAAGQARATRRSPRACALGTTACSATRWSPRMAAPRAD